LLLPTEVQNIMIKTIYNDIMILTLTQPVKFTDKVKPICLPAETYKYNKGFGTTVGWGKTEKGTYPKILMEKKVKIITTKEFCKKDLVCTEPGLGDGDSGGPFMVMENGRTAQIGVTSGDKGKIMSVFTRVSYHLDWIKKIAPDAKNTKCE